MAGPIEDLRAIAPIDEPFDFGGVRLQLPFSVFPYGVDQMGRTLVETYLTSSAGEFAGKGLLLAEKDGLEPVILEPLTGDPSALRFRHSGAAAISRSSALVYAVQSADDAEREAAILYGRPGAIKSVLDHRDLALDPPWRLRSVSGLAIGDRLAGAQLISEDFQHGLVVGAPVDAADLFGQFFFGECRQAVGSHDRSCDYALHSEARGLSTIERADHSGRRPPFQVRPIRIITAIFR